MPSTADGAATPHVEINIKASQHSGTKLHANNKATTWSCNKKERQTNTKVYNDGQRAHAAMTSRCGNRLTQTDRQTNR